MKNNEFKFKAKVWLYPGAAAWHFVSVPKTESAKIKKMFLGLERGFGSFPVMVKLGQTTWKTSIFPQSKTGEYLLPLKASVRKKENILAGQTISFRLAVNAI